MEHLIRELREAADKTFSNEDERFAFQAILDCELELLTAMGFLRMSDPAWNSVPQEVRVLHAKGLAEIFAAESKTLAAMAIYLARYHDASRETQV